MSYSRTEFAEHILVLSAVLIVMAIRPSYAMETDDKLTGRLLCQASELKEEGYYLKAIPLYRQILAIQINSDGDNLELIAKRNFELGEILCLAGKYTEAKECLEKSLEIRTELFGSDSLGVAENCNQIGLFLTSMGKYEKAEKYLHQAITIREKVYGDNHILVAESLLNKAILYLSLGENENAEELLIRVLKIQKSLLKSDDPEFIKTLNSFGWLHINSGDYLKAINTCEEALSIGEANYGNKHPYIADSLYNLSLSLNYQEKYEESIRQGRKSLQMRQEFLGNEHPDVAFNMHSIAMTYSNLDQYDIAESIFKEALLINEKVFGSKSFILLGTVDYLGWIYKVRGNYPEALPYYERAVTICKKNYESNSLEVATQYKNLAEIYYYLGEYDKAENLLDEAIIVFMKTLDMDHPRIAATYSLIAFTNHAKGDQKKAEEYYIKCIDISEKKIEKNPKNFATTLNNLATFYMEVGNYEKAILYFQRALDIFEGTIGTDNNTVAAILNNMGRLYNSMADYEKAESLFNQSLLIFEKTLGPDHPNTAVVLDNLAILYEHQDEYKKAERLYTRVLNIRVNKLGPSHPSVARTQNNLATIYLFLKENEKGIKLLRQVLKTKEENIGIDNPSYAKSLNNLATILYRLGDYEEGEALYLQALKIWEKTLGPDHPEVSTAYGHLAHLYAIMGDYNKAYSFAVKGIRIDNKTIDQVFGFTSEAQQLKFISSNTFDSHFYLNLIVSNHLNDSFKRKEALDFWFKRKGIVLDIQKRFQVAGTMSKDPEITNLIIKLNDVRAKLSKLTFAERLPENENNYKKILDELENEKEMLESQISRISKPYALKQTVIKASSEQIARELPVGTALIEFARIETTKYNSKDQSESIPLYQYVAFILHAGQGDDVSMVDLGDADNIDRAIVKYKKQLSESGNGNAENALRISKQLYDLIFKPLSERLDNTKEIFLSPDGSLNLIPFEVLQGPDGKFLIEEYTFNYLSAGRDILGFGETADLGNKFLFMGAPDFNLKLAERPTSKSNRDIDESKLMANRSANLKEISIEPLLYAKAELEAVGEIMGRENSQIYIGKQASEEILVNTHGPEILHLATHGFFLGEQDFPGTGRGWQTENLTANVSQASGRIDREIIAENPLLRSGILLAGAKRSLLIGETGNNDGIVTAAKILGMNLYGTKMVVLSACDTGLGEVRSGEGVFGLRRAFIQAGAKSLVMSLWKVPDRETKELMVQFYHNLKSGEMNRCQALRQATLNEMETVRERYGHTNPRYWGAFVFMGES
ncbi:MAG: tetratricopeptide repeat protein [Desulfobacteraceae bacterium]|nr:tetratricopeptide repeat protein [Desulfobacteraceae bacterium]MBC2752574.1 tetratricopeptide repeat protein [Desulfobacteraceae bacterium]